VKKDFHGLLPFYKGKSIVSIMQLPSFPHITFLWQGSSTFSTTATSLLESQCSVYSPMKQTQAQMEDSLSNPEPSLGC